MKRIFTAIAGFALAAVLIVLPACSDGNANKSGDTKAATAVNKKDGSKKDLPNYRYVDLDTVLDKYNLAKDYNEEMLRLQTNMENEVKRHENSLQSLATQIQTKMQNSGYANEAAYKADQQKYTNMQTSAQKSVTTLQQNFENQAMTAQQAVNDSIQVFIKEYNAQRGYDAIFFKAATLYIDPALDITNEVIEGLNARYNKMKK